MHLRRVCSLLWWVVCVVSMCIHLMCMFEHLVICLGTIWFAVNWLFFLFCRAYYILRGKNLCLSFELQIFFFSLLFVFGICLWCLLSYADILDFYVDWHIILRMIPRFCPMFRNAFPILRLENSFSPPLFRALWFYFCVI